MHKSVSLSGHYLSFVAKVYATLLAKVEPETSECRMSPREFLKK